MGESSFSPGGIGIIEFTDLAEFLRTHGVNAPPPNGGVIILFGPDNAACTEDPTAQGFGPGGIPIIERTALAEFLRTQGVGALPPNGIIILLGA